MPKPTKDYAAHYRRDITKVDERIAKLQDLRLRLVTAYAIITGDEKTYGVPAPELNPPPIAVPSPSKVRAGKAKTPIATGE